LSRSGKRKETVARCGCDSSFQAWAESDGRHALAAFSLTHAGIAFDAESDKETPMSAEILLTVEEAALRLKLSKHTLNRWRVNGAGPPFVKYGPRLVRYNDRVLDEWAAKRTHGSTSEYGRESR
jgi:excisionase family DNA binding protein